MTLSEELVQAAAEAMCFGVCPEGAHEAGENLCGEAANVALQAAFAKLGECDEARSQIIRHMTPCLARPLGPDDEPCLLLDGHEGEHGFAFPRAHYADAALAALAREFGTNA